jgi:PAS domain-containing protein
MPLIWRTAHGIHPRNGRDPAAVKNDGERMETPTSSPRIITIPSSDAAFREHVQRLTARDPSATAGDLQARLRMIFPRVVVRERALSSEPSAWYVYRDGGWKAAATGTWWEEPGLPRVAVSAEGWITEANRPAGGLLGIDPTDTVPHHFTDFIVPGTLEDSMSLFSAIDVGMELEATILLRPTSGDVIALDLHAERVGADIVGVFRLAGDVDFAVSDAATIAPDRFTCFPPTDAAFRGYVERALARMPEPTPDGLALRLRRLYPHANVEVEDGEWRVRRERASELAQAPKWWLDPALPRVRYDAQALIAEANAPAEDLFGRSMVGHYWQEFVTPGSTEQVTTMLEILAAVGAAESRFRMPRGDGSLVEFDSYTEVQGEEFLTVIRPIE